MVDVQQTLTSQQVKMLMRQLRRIAAALENPPDIDQPDVSESLLATATANLDYLALRQLMKRAPRRSEPAVLFLAGCDRTGGKPSLLIGEVPADATQVAVFTGRGEPADLVDLTTHATTYAAGKQKRVPYPLDHVGMDEDITRVEFRRGDHFPLGIAQRLPA
jgi:hypothetical protein